MHARVDGIFRRDYASDWYGAGFVPGWTGVRHHGTGADGGYAHKFAHVCVDTSDVRDFVVTLGADVAVIVERSRVAQPDRWPGASCATMARMLASSSPRLSAAVAAAKAVANHEPGLYPQEMSVWPLIIEVLRVGW